MSFFGRGAQRGDLRPGVADVGGEELVTRSPGSGGVYKPRVQSN